MKTPREILKHLKQFNLFLSHFERLYVFSIDSCLAMQSSQRPQTYLHFDLLTYSNNPPCAIFPAHKLVVNTLNDVQFKI